MAKKSEFEKLLEEEIKQAETNIVTIVAERKRFHLRGLTASVKMMERFLTREVATKETFNYALKAYKKMEKKK